jgi:hypothetical protein
MSDEELIDQVRRDLPALRALTVPIQLTPVTEAKATARDLVAIFRAYNSTLPTPFANSHLMALLQAACIQLAISETVDAADYSDYEFTYAGVTCPLQPLVQAIHARHHPVKPDDLMTVRCFARAFARPTFEYFKERNDNPAFWPALAKKYHTLCEDSEYCAIDFLPKFALWMTSEEMRVSTAVREKALTESGADEED